MKATSAVSILCPQSIQNTGPACRDSRHRLSSRAQLDGCRTHSWLKVVSKRPRSNGLAATLSQTRSAIASKMLSEERASARIRFEKRFENSRPALLDGARAGRVRQRRRRLPARSRSRPARRAAAMPLPGRRHDCHGPGSQVESDEEGGQEIIPEPGRVARRADHDGVDRYAGVCAATGDAHVCSARAKTGEPDGNLQQERSRGAAASSAKPRERAQARGWHSAR